MAAQLGAIEAELRRLGMWSAEPPAPSAFESQVAFFGDTMAFEQWLQFVLLPRVQAVLGGDGTFPTRSMVGAYAVRELDGHPDAGHLVDLLVAFDGLIAPGAGAAGSEGTADLEGSATALTWAASAGSLRAVADLLDSGIDPGIQDVYGVTPIFFAAGYGHTGVCAWLIDPAGTSLGADLWGEHAPTAGHLEILRLLIERGAAVDDPYSPLGGYESGGGTPLLLAAALGHDAACDELLRAGASPTRADVTGRTAPDWAATRGFAALAARLRPR